MADRIRKINASTRDTAHVVILSNLPASARINSIEVSADGTIYGADFAQDVVYKIYENGDIHGVLAGDLGSSGVVHATGIGTSTGLTARFDSPIGMTVDRSNNIYVGCASGNLIRRMSPSGRVVPFAGNAASNGDAVADSGEDARFEGTSTGMGLACDLAGNVYLADTGNHKIKKLFPSGKSTVMAGGPGGAGTSGFVNATGNTARFSSPLDVAVDRHGNVYVADSANNRIRKVTESGVVTTLAGQAASGNTDGDGITARFNSPRRLAIDPSNQFLYVLEGSAVERVRRVDMHGNTTTFMHYNIPSSGNGDITVDNSGFVYILENDSD